MPPKQLSSEQVLAEVRSNDDVDLDDSGYINGSKFESKSTKVLTTNTVTIIRIMQAQFLQQSVVVLLGPGWQCLCKTLQAGRHVRGRGIAGVRGRG